MQPHCELLCKVFYIEMHVMVNQLRCKELYKEVISAFVYLRLTHVFLTLDIIDMVMEYV